MQEEQENIEKEKDNLFSFSNYILYERHILIFVSICSGVVLEDYNLIRRRGEYNE